MNATSPRAADPASRPVRLAATRALAAALAVAAPAPAAQAAPGASASTSDRTANAEQPTVERNRAKRLSIRMVRRALNVVRDQKGDTYRYGASGPHAFDCSGLVRYSYSRAGFRNVPRTSSAQANWVRRIARHQMRPGDLVFFTDGGGVYHVGVFTRREGGTRWIVHAPGSGSRVKTAKIWTNSWFSGTLRRR